VTKKFIGSILLVFQIVALMLAAASAAPAQDMSAELSQLTPDQLQQLSQLTPEQRKKLIDQFTQSRGQGSQQSNPAFTADLRYLQDQSNNSNAPSPRQEYAPGQPLKPFGYDVFSTPTSTFAPVTDIPIPADYVVGPGDVLQVQLFGNSNASYNLVVNRDGSIDFPKLGPINVAGQRFDDVRSMLQERIAKEMIGVQASITIGELRSIRVFLLGDVNQPGSYTVSSLSTITNALLAGGGISLIGSLRDVELKRNGKLVRTLDLYDLLLHGDSSGDERLLPGDVIFVPPVGQRVSIDGDVKRPAIYELKGETSVSQALKLAGGIRASTSTRAVQIERYDQNQKRTLIQIDVSKPTDLAMRVQDGDVIKIRKLAGPPENHVRVIGFVRYPGAYEWSHDNDLSDLLKDAQVLPSQTNEEAYLPLGLVERTDADTGVRGWFSFNVRDALQGSQHIPLKRDDLVIIFSRNDVSYLSSREVRAVLSGDQAPSQGCPALSTLATRFGHERALGFLKELSLDSTASNGQSIVSARQGNENGIQPSKAVTPSSSGSATNHQQIQAQTEKLLKVKTAEAQGCPKVFTDAPRALPYLLDQTVAVYGEVHRPGLYPIVAGTPLKLLVDAAGGLTNESDRSDIEYVSYADALKTGQPEYQHVNFTKSPALEISPGDMLTFKPLYSGQEVGTVEAKGEFRFPGTFGILRGERLSELIRRAGGLTGGAYPYGAVFTRESARKAEEASYQRAANELQEAMVTAVTSGALGKEAPISAQFLTSTIDHIEHAKAAGRVVIETNPAVLAAHPDLDPILEPGDAIYMPKTPISVTVTGQVLNPGSLEYLPGTSVKQYINSAGGYTQAADTGRIFVILPNGTSEKIRNSFWSPSSTKIPAGSVIVVPRDATPFSLLGYSDRIFGILANMAVSTAALVTISKL
jgi:protein involved in polysaccharide export with SLBB domain